MDDINKDIGIKNEQTNSKEKSHSWEATNGEDNANSVHEGEKSFSIVRGEDWTFICPIDFVQYQFNSGRDNSGFIVSHRVFIRL